MEEKNGLNDSWVDFYNALSQDKIIKPTSGLSGLKRADHIKQQIRYLLCSPRSKVTWALVSLHNNQNQESDSVDADIQKRPVLLLELASELLLAYLRASAKQAKARFRKLLSAA